MEFTGWRWSSLSGFGDIPRKETAGVGNGEAKDFVWHHYININPKVKYLTCVSTYTKKKRSEKTNPLRNHKEAGTF